MANKSRRRRGRKITSQNYRKVQIQSTIGLTTLVSHKPEAATILTNLLDKVKVSSLYLNFVWDDMTGTGGNQNEDGPLLIGVAHGDYTLDEIEEFIEAVTSIDFGDKIAAERSRRLMRTLGTLSAMQISFPGHGGLKKIKLNWTLGEASTLLVWAYNLGGSDLTTGSQLEISGYANVWRL